MKISARMVPWAGACPGQKAEEVEDRGRVGCGQILEPAEERRVAQFDGDEDHLVEREEDRDLDQDGQAARGGVDLLILVKLHHFLLQLLLVVAGPFLERLKFRLQFLHLGHADIGFIGQRQDEEFEEEGQADDGEAHVADEWR